jgi:hypothetical protein
MIEHQDALRPTVNALGVRVAAAKEFPISATDGSIAGTSEEREIAQCEQTYQRLAHAPTWPLAPQEIAGIWTTSAFVIGQALAHFRILKHTWRVTSRYHRSFSSMITAGRLKLQQFLQSRLSIRVNLALSVLLYCWRLGNAK